MAAQIISDGSVLKVTFSAAVDGIDLPFGADRHLLAWLFDKAINADTPFVAFRNASEYLRETGKTLSGQRVKELGPEESGMFISYWAGIAIDPQSGRLRGAGTAELPSHAEGY